MHDESRDYITIENNQGNRKDFAIEALFDMEEATYALLSAEDETIVMRVEGEEGNQYLVGLMIHWKASPSWMLIRLQ